jgi:ribosome-associated protein
VSRRRPRDGGERVSKSRRKRESAELQALGEALLDLRPEELEAVHAPADLKEAIRDAFRIRKREALRRQRQYIGRLMREVDPEPIREFLERRQAVQRAETRLFHEAEAWRQRLLDGGEQAVVSGGTEIGIDEDVLRRAVGEVRSAPTEPARKSASRALFRLVHDHLVARHSIDSD